MVPATPIRLLLAAAMMRPVTLRFASSFFAAALWLACGTGASAQQGASADTPLRRETSRSAPQLTPPTVEAEDTFEPVPEGAPLEYLPVDHRTWEFKPRFAVQWQHDTNVFLDSSDGVVANAWTARPAFSLRDGDNAAPARLDVDYEADLTFYDGVSGEDTVNHFLNSSLVYQTAKLRVTLSAQLLRFTGGDFDAGGQSERLQLLPALEIQYALAAKTSAGVAADMRHSDYVTYLDSVRYRVGVFADHQVSPNTRLGLQANQIFEDVDGTGRQTAQEFLLRLNYGRHSKVSVFGNAGVEIREPANADDIVTPVGRLGIAYRPSETFRVSLDFYRTATPSVSLEGQYFYATGLLLRASEQMFERFTLGLDCGYEQAKYESALSSVTADREDDITLAKYESVLSSVTADREDDITLLRPWLRYAFTDWASVEVFYQYTKDDSSGRDAQPFRREQTGIGFNMSW
jgi:hypothetical protein